MSGQPQTGDFTLAAAIRRYFDVVLFLLIFSGFGTLASTGRLDLPTVLLVSAALLYRGFGLARRHQLLLPENWTNLLTIACVGFFVADEFLVSRNFLGAIIHLVLFGMLVMLFSVQRDFHHYLLAVLSFAMVLAAAVLTVDSTFLLALAGFVLVGIAAFMLMEMMHSAQRAQVLARDPQVRLAYRKLSFAVAAIAPVLLLLIFVGGAVIFFLLPRVSAGYLSASTGANDITSGFSDHVELGRIGQIQQSTTVVMHVQVDGDTAGAFALKLRGVALNHFDGRNWSSAWGKVNLHRGPDGSFELNPRSPQSSPRLERILRYRVIMEPFLSDVFFLLATPKSLEGNYRAVSQDSAGDVFDLDAEHPVARYTASSELRTADANLRANSSSYPPEALPGYLELPPLDPRIKPLADQITAKASSPYQRAVALENYLRTHYGYTLQLPDTAPPDPIANFLFVRHQGHCEYFASAMAVMLRSVGVPSRVVNGFAGGEFNDLTSEYVIRASDAHSWVEAYIPGEGWMEFDPTPSGAGEAHTKWDRVMLYMDAMSSFWREWVINYDLGHQLRLTQDANRGSRALVGEAQSWGRTRYEKILAWARRTEDTLGNSTVKWGERAFGLILIVLFLANVPRMLVMLGRFRLARRPQKSPQTAATIWYERLLRYVARRGWEKSPAQTPEEFAALIRDPRLKERVSEFTERYEQARFGASADDAARLPDLYEEIKSIR